uniref:GRAM domain-containing protein n=1 Tax=Anas platyrhynchos TaxID=8839 RepID=A0A8B9ST00_ANAPL
MSGKLKKSRKAALGEKQWQSLEERGSAGTQPGSHPALTRSKTYDPSCKETEEAEGAGGRHGSLSSSLNKRSSSFRKAFEEIAGREALLACFSCAWQREVPYHGRLYVSSGHVCFHASLLLKDIKAVVPVTSICALKKTNTALLVPNALSIRTAEGDKDNGWSPLASPLNGSTAQSLKKPLTSSQSDLEESPAEPDSLLEPPEEASQAKEEAAATAEDTAAAGRGERGPRRSRGRSRGPGTAQIWPRRSRTLPDTSVVLGRGPQPSAPHPKCCATEPLQHHHPHLPAAVSPGAGPPPPMHSPQPWWPPAATSRL